MGTETATLARAAELVDRPIERDGRGRRVVVCDYGQAWLEVRPAHLFDERGVTVALYGPEGRYLSTKSFTMDRLRQIIRWVTRLALKPDALRKNGKVERLVWDYNSAVFDRETRS